MRIRQFFSESLHHRLVLYFMLLMMIPISVAGTLIYHASDVRISDGALALAEEVIEKTGENMEEVLLDMQSAAKQVAEDHTIQSLLAQLQVPEISEESVISALDARLKQIASMYAGLDLSLIHICTGDGFSFQYDPSGSKWKALHNPFRRVYPATNIGYAGQKRPG